MQLTNFPGMIYYNFNHANGRMVERGVTYTGKKDLTSRNVFASAPFLLASKNYTLRVAFNLALKTSEDSYTCRTDMELCKQK